MKRHKKKTKPYKVIDAVMENLDGIRIFTGIMVGVVVLFIGSVLYVLQSYLG